MLHFQLHFMQERISQFSKYQSELNYQNNELHSFIHWVSKRIFYRPDLGFYFKSCLLFSNHSLLFLSAKKAPSFYYVTWLCNCIMQLGEPTQWIIGIYPYSSLGQLALTMHSSVCEPHRDSPLYSKEIDLNSVFP